MLYFALREAPDVPPFLLVYLYRGPREDVDAAREATFASLHTRLAGGEEVRS